LEEHLYIEGDTDQNLRFDGRSLRVKTDDDEVDLAYMFVEDSAATPERWAYLLHDEWPLPSATGAGEGSQPRTHVVFLTFTDGGSLDLPGPVTFDGIRLTELPDRLRGSNADERAGWPRELQVLYGMVAPGDETIADAVGRANRWPGFDLNSRLPTTAMLDVPADQKYEAGRDPGQSRIEASDHIVQMAIYLSEPLGYQQWFLFDDVWAGAYPALAQSLVRYATHWDPLE
jgi:hypothetical protein